MRIDPNDPEFTDVDTFAEFLFDDERDTYNHLELMALHQIVRRPVHEIKKALATYGLTLVDRPKKRKIRGFTSNPHDRWYGPGSCPTHGGSGWAQIMGFAGQEG